MAGETADGGQVQRYGWIASGEALGRTTTKLSAMSTAMQMLCDSSCALLAMKRAFPNVG